MEGLLATIGVLATLFFLFVLPILTFTARSRISSLEKRVEYLQRHLNAVANRLAALDPELQASRPPEHTAADTRKSEQWQTESESREREFSVRPSAEAAPFSSPIKLEPTMEEHIDLSRRSFVLAPSSISIPEPPSITEVEPLPAPVPEPSFIPEVEPLHASILEVPPVPKTSPAVAAQAPAKATQTPVFTPRATPKVMPVAARPEWLDRFFAWCIGGNPMVKVGMLILFFGVSFLLKLAADQGWFPPELRLACVALGAGALLVIGWRLREKRRNYGLLLQGGGVGILYLVIFTAFAYLELIPKESALFAFLLLFAVCALSAFLAVRQEASALAVMGMTGGFAAPVLISTGSGDHIMLFSYFALLNAGVLGIAWFRAWRALNLLGFVFTLGVGSAWAMKYYTPMHLYSVEFFLVLFFLFYVAVALLYAVRRELELKHYVDGTLVFGAPIAFSLLQARLVGEIEFGMAWSMVGLGALYLLLATWLARYRLQRLRLFFEASLALGVLFLTLAVPLAFEGTRLTAAIWAVEGAGLCWVAVRQRRLLALIAGLALQGFATASFFLDPSVSMTSDSPLVLNSWYLGALMLTLSALFCGWRLRSEAARSWLEMFWQPLSLVLRVFGLLWWLGSGIMEILRKFGSFEPSSYAYLLFAVLTAWLARCASRNLRWSEMEWVALALSPTLLFAACLSFFYGLQPLSGWGLLAWPLAVVLAYVLLFQQERRCEQQLSLAWLLGPLHALMFWTVCLVAGLQFHGFVGTHVPEGIWQWSSWVFTGALLLLALIHIAPRFAWPFRRFRPHYLTLGAAPVALLLLIWAFMGLASNGNPEPLRYIPFLNPVELCQLLVFATLVSWVRANKEPFAALPRINAGAFPTWLIACATALLFLMLNTALLRTLHQYTGLNYHVGAVIAELGAQLYFVALWIVFAAASMLLLKRVSASQQRVLLVIIPLLLPLLWLWNIFSNFSADSSKWGVFPLLNPFDLAQAGIVVLSVFILLRLRAMDGKPAQYLAVLPAVIGGGCFIWLNAMLLRTLHHHLGVPYEIEAVIIDLGVQLYFVALWLVFATAGMLLLRRMDASRQRVLIPIILLMLSLLWFWSVFSNFSADSSRWGNLPLLNPFDLAQAGIVALSLFVLIRLRAMDGKLAPFLAILPAVIGGGCFIWLNAMLLRTLHHHWSKIPYNFDAFYASTTAQAALSLLWGFLALILMVWAVRRAQRVLWFIGITLLAATVGKLIFVELARIGGIARIISFIGVGVLLLLIGYLAPLPPKKKEDV